MTYLKKNEASEQRKNGNITKAIAIYLEVKLETPIDLEVHQKLAELYFINRLYDKSLQSYLIAIHLMASAHFRKQIPNEEAINYFLAHCPFIAQTGCSLIGLQRKSLKLRVQSLFDLDNTLDLYRLSLINKQNKLPESFVYFCKNLGTDLVNTTLKWEKLELKNTNDVWMMIRFYESLCSDEKETAA